MREENRAIRQDHIERAAYAELREKGYAGTSMLGVAKRAKASNETLYNWYGDKLGLFLVLVARNADEVRAHLEASLKEDAPALDILADLGPKLLTLLVGSRAVALNQAAAADPTGELGAAISEAGRETVAPLIRKTIEKAGEEGVLSFRGSQQATELYISLLVGDLQIRRVIGREAQPDADFIAERSKTAFDYFCQLLSP
ncbi:MAG: TetR/AcrR family transcriptional regulator [Hyphomicrobiales bacterium]|nr:TetR/AcrR family transcriptional regulator [Hyphomicrobiales bacterium]